VTSWEHPDTPVYLRGYGDGVAAARIEIIEWIAAHDPVPGSTAWELLDGLRRPSATPALVGHKAEQQHGAAVPERGDGAASKSDSADAARAHSGNPATPHTNPQGVTGTPTPRDPGKPTRWGAGG
jgi:hypothetical protein